MSVFLTCCMSMETRAPGGKPDLRNCLTIRQNSVKMYGYIRQEAHFKFTKFIPYTMTKYSVTLIKTNTKIS